MVVTVTGRKSGKRYVFPVSYIERENRLFCFTQNQWWRNIRDGSEIELRFRGRVRTGTAKVTAQDADAVQTGLGQLLQKIPRDAAYYNVPLQGRIPDAGAIARAARSTVMVEITIQIRH